MATAERQQWSPEQYAKNARFVSDLGMPVVTLLAPRAGERILDVGCGDGPLTKKLVEFGCKVIAVDASSAMVEAAKAMGLDAQVMDGEALQFAQEFDAVFSNAALHWMKQADAVIAGVWRALKPGGRFVAEFGGAGNNATVLHALKAALVQRSLDFDTLSPWYFPSVEEYRGKLAVQGFVVNTIALIPRPTPLPGSLVAWLETFAQSFVAPLPLEERTVFLAEVADRCRSTLC
ncbi:MAG: trans-aconitate 2-methyltransferase, partial [Candidatus Binatia bacterium]